ncbi:tRNA/rRNA methyltransferase [Elusimicrobium simillimum]|uniref:RNA methyltransferase n=1 Tax=Elusimicrobium simillimum TaxID=3143438 RepID=UPI003C6FB7A9
MTAIILVRPRNPNNIGAAARAMANFGLADLRIVAAHPPVLEEAVAAVGAEKILKKAKTFNTLAEALADTNFSLAATSLKNRKAEQKIISLPDIKKVMGKGKTAIVFGQEKTGLSNEDIALCTTILNIPTAAAQPSINLAQAVVLTCYELSKSSNFKKLKINKLADLPSAKDIDIVTQILQGTFTKLNFQTALTVQDQQNLVRSILNAANLTKKQLFIIKKYANLIE